MEQFLIDNNVISNYFSERFPEKSMNFITAIIDDIPNISVITEIEALSWINPDKRKEQIVREFLQDANVLMISPAIVAECVAIRRSKKIKTPDAIIAATAIAHDFTLVTSDSGLKNIPGLRSIDPFDL